MKRRPYILAESTWTDIKDSYFQLAILPWGATEAHNFHLPYSTDVIESDIIAAESARIAWERGAKVIVLPSIPIGVNTGQQDIKLDLNLNPSTQAAILTDIITTLDRQGIKRLLILNSHGGNNFKQILREIGLQFSEMMLGTCDWFRSVDKKMYFEESGDHADEMETSLMLYLKPHLVLPLDIAGEGREKRINLKGVQDGWAWMERQWTQATSDTGIGNPKKASAEKGEAYFKVVTQKVGDLMYEMATVEPDQLYIDSLNAQ